MVDFKHHDDQEKVPFLPLVVTDKEPLIHAPLLDDDDDDDDDNVFSAATRASTAQRKRSLVTLVLAALLWLSLIGPRLPDVSTPHELKPGSLRGPCHGAWRWMNPQRPADHRHAVVTSYVDGLANLGSHAKNALSSTLTRGIDLDRINRFLEAIYLGVPSPESAHDALRRYTNVTHVAGSQGDKDNAVRVMAEWGKLLGADVPEDPYKQVFDAGSPESIRYMTAPSIEFEKPPTADPGRRTRTPRVWVDTYSVWLNSPVSQSLSMTHEAEDKPFYEASLKEDVLDEDPFTKETIPVYHGYSKSGNASGPIVYANLCRVEDFAELRKRNVNVKGAITLCRYGGPFRGLKVRASALEGAVATIIYSDPAEDGEVTEANGYKAYPEGPARNPSAVQRGSVQALSFFPGDPSTPGKPSYRNATRLDPETADSLPKIPSLPISYRDAAPILKALQSHGEQIEGWAGAVPGVEGYFTGPTKDVAHLSNIMSDVSKPKDIWNAYAKIPGIIEDEVIVVGNHNDAWTFGAGDPSSGTAAMHEVVKGLSAMVTAGWRPLRTILIASWDAEEYGLVGSTEFVEDYAEYLKRTAVAYLNTDVASSGKVLHISASPSLADLFRNAAAEVKQPYGDAKLEVKKVSPLGSGSDYTAFLQYLGVASSDTGFARSAKDPVYHYHSTYDDLYWQEKYGDPSFKNLDAIARVMGLTTLRLADSLFLPINITAYSLELQTYVAKVEDIKKTAQLREGEKQPRLGPLEHAIKRLIRASKKLDAKKVQTERELKRLFEDVGNDEDQLVQLFDMARIPPRPKSMVQRVRCAFARKLRLGFAGKHVAPPSPPHDGPHPPHGPPHPPHGPPHPPQPPHGPHGPSRRAQKLRHLMAVIAQLNSQLRHFERGFISHEGLKGRSWYKHLIVAPGRWKGYGATTTPGLTEALTLDGGEGAEEEAARIQKLVEGLAQRIEKTVRETERHGHGPHRGPHHRHGEKKPHHHHPHHDHHVEHDGKGKEHQKHHGGKGE